MVLTIFSLNDRLMRVRNIFENRRVIKILARMNSSLPPEIFAKYPAVTHPRVMIRPCKMVIQSSENFSKFLLDESEGL